MDTPTIIILAAGASSRLGQAKQLLVYKNKSLLSHIVDEAGKTRAPVIVVLGANEKDIKKELTNTSASIVYNKNWKDGMATSICAGLTKAIENDPGVKNCFFCVCDQPHVSAALFGQLIDKKKASGKKIIASAYAGTLGTPVLFDRHYFEELLQLQGDEGAKKLLKKYDDDVAAIGFEKGEIDIDLPADYEKLLKETTI